LVGSQRLTAWAVAQPLCGWNKMAN
jgi:hypothetical protein